MYYRHILIGGPTRSLGFCLFIFLVADKQAIASIQAILHHKSEQADSNASTVDEDKKEVIPFLLPISIRSSRLRKRGSIAQSTQVYLKSD